MKGLLTILSDGRFHSGEELGSVLGISRTAVWKQIQKIEQTGLEIKSRRGCGYCLMAELELLDRNTLIHNLSATARSLIRELQVELSVPSTNDLVRNAAEQGDATGLIVLAEQQTAGRGRRGRLWISPFGRNVYLSLGWGFDGGVQVLEGLSLAVGVAVRRAIQSCGIHGLMFKWPNDLFLEDKKVGGILLEVLGDPSGFCQVIIGVGINLGMPDKSGELIDQAWTDIGLTSGRPVSRNRLASAIIEEMLALLENFHEVGFAPYREEWLRFDINADRKVNLILMNKTVQGIARGVDESGALKLEIGDEIKRFSGGEISLRSAE